MMKDWVHKMINEVQGFLAMRIKVAELRPCLKLQICEGSVLFGYIFIVPKMVL